MNLTLKCRHCGDEIDFYFSNWEELYAHDECFNCNYWMHRVRVPDSRRVITPDYIAYYIGDETDSPSYMRGYGGIPWIIEWVDKSKKPQRSTNLWHNGTIPRHLQYLFTPNATVHEDRRESLKQQPLQR